MLCLFSIFLLASVGFTLSSDECSIGIFDNTQCIAICLPSYEVYNITDPSLTINDIANICPNVKWARAWQEVGDSCTYNDLLWDMEDELCSCPSCPCDITTDNTNLGFLSYQTFFDQTCIGCACQGIAGSNESWWDCTQYGDVTTTTEISYTTINSWENFECPPTHTCISNNGTEYLPGDGYWDTSKCDTFCFCNANGTQICRTGYDASNNQTILGIGDDLFYSFIDRCGVSIQGSIGITSSANILSKQTLNKCGNVYGCPKCGCAANGIGDRWAKKEIYLFDPSYTVCLSCICMQDEENNIVAMCESNEIYPNTEYRDCPSSMGPQCYYGLSQDDQKQRKTYATAIGNCEKSDGFCGWERHVNPFDGTVENKWGCVSSMLCEAAGITDGCFHTSGTITPSFFGCGTYNDNGFQWDIYQGCFDQELGNSADIPTDMQSCEQSEILDNFYSILFSCFSGSNNNNYYGWTGKKLNYDILKCTNHDDIGCQDLVKNAPYDVEDYIHWSFGCACSAASYLYSNVEFNSTHTPCDQSTSSNSIWFDNFVDDLDNFVKKFASISGEDGMAWAEDLGCNVGKVSCNLETGQVNISPKECGFLPLGTENNMYNELGFCGVFCPHEEGYASGVGFYPNPAEVLTFEQIREICPSVAKGLCTSKDELVWPDIDVGCCPYCACDADLVIDVEYFFGKQCTVCNCTKINAAGDNGTLCVIYGDEQDAFIQHNYFNTFETWDLYKCPPDEGTTCVNGYDSYLTGQSFYSIYGYDTFCICMDGITQCQYGGYTDILTSDIDGLTQQFLNRCGASLQGCLNESRWHDIITRTVLFSLEKYEDCPICGCSTQGIAWHSEELTYSTKHHNKICRTCVCAMNVTIDGVLSALCDEQDPYSRSTNMACPAETSSTCYHAQSSHSGIFANSQPVSAKCSDVDQTYCGMYYDHHHFEIEDTEEQMYQWECSSRWLCEIFGVTDGTKCIKAEYTYKHGLMCGEWDNFLGDTSTQISAFSCCNSVNCNNVDIDINQCETNDALGAFLSSVYGCLPERQNQFECIDGATTIINCEHFQQYVTLHYGCYCESLNILYNIVNDTLVSYQGYLQDTMDTYLNDWNEHLQCDLVWTCEIETGTVTVGTASPSSTPTLGPTPSPTTENPTQTPTKYPTVSPTRQPTPFRAYEQYFQVAYLLKNLMDREIIEIINDGIGTFKNITKLIEFSYVENLSPYLDYADFWLIMENINNINIEDTNKNDNDKRIIQYAKESLQLNSRILCNEIVCNYLLENYNITKFEIETQSRIRNYFEEIANLNAADNDIHSLLTFEVDTSQTISIKELYPIVASPWLEPSLLGLLSFIFVMMVFSFLALLHNKQKLCKFPGSSIVDDANWICLIILSLQIFDFVSDIILSAEMFRNNDLSFHSEKLAITICTMASAVFVILPYSLNLWMASSIKKLTCTNRAAVTYFTNYTAVFVGLVCCCGSSFVATQVVSSAVFGLNIFNSGLTSYEITKLSKFKIWGTIWAENVPQVIIQATYSYLLGSITNNTYISFSASVLSVIAASLGYVIEKSNDGTDRDVVQYSVYIQMDNKQNEIVSISDKQKAVFLENKGRTEALAKSIAAIFATEPKNIEFSKQSMLTNYGIVHQIVQFVNRNDIDSKSMQNLLDRDGGYTNIMISSEFVVEKLYGVFEEEINSMFQKHYCLNSSFRTTIVKNAMLQSNSKLNVSANKYTSKLLQKMKSVIELQEINNKDD
eukprot:513070_1